MIWMVKKVSITEVKNNLRVLIDRVQGDSLILIVDRGRPVARLERVMAERNDKHGGRLSRLLRDGIVRPRRNLPPRTLFSRQPPRARAGASVVEALLQERREGP
jgi:antitoxin (DNA-binding transcriptional repressor) of toxin-antitoxin stability system